MRGFRVIAVLLVFAGFCTLALPQTGSPPEVVANFYRLLQQKQYVQGFHLSVYDEAVSTLSASELDELRPDFDKTFAKIPDGIVIKGETIAQDVATVRIQMPGSKDEQSVDLIRVGGQWKVGDFETYNLVRQQGHEFFFNARMYVNEREIAEILKDMMSTEILYAQNHKGKMAMLADLVSGSAGLLPKELVQGDTRGYHFDLRITNNGSSFEIIAVPSRYGRTGKLSFYANAAGVHAQDMKGQMASVTAPFFQY